MEKELKNFWEIRLFYPKFWEIIYREEFYRNNPLPREVNDLIEENCLDLKNLNGLAAKAWKIKDLREKNLTWEERFDLYWEEDKRDYFLIRKEFISYNSYPEIRNFCKNEINSSKKIINILYSQRKENFTLEEDPLCKTNNLFVRYFLLLVLLFFSIRTFLYSQKRKKESKNIFLPSTWSNSLTLKPNLLRPRLLKSTLLGFRLLFIVFTRLIQYLL